MFAFTEQENRIVHAVHRRGGHVWVVGGAVRDVCRGATPHDIDLATDLVPSESASAVRSVGLTLGQDQTADQHGMVRVATPEGLVDLATLRCDTNCDGRHAQVAFTKSINEDLGRRDFTFNAMAVEVLGDGGFGPVIDPFGGQRDLADGRIEFVGDAETRIREDFLRSIRACRFTALFPGASFSEETRKAIASNQEGVAGISKERVRDEVMKAMKTAKPSSFFRSLLACGLLEIVAAPIAACVGVEQNAHHGTASFTCRKCGESISFTQLNALRAHNQAHC